MTGLMGPVGTHMKGFHFPPKTVTCRMFTNLPFPALRGIMAEPTAFWRVDRTHQASPGQTRLKHSTTLQLSFASQT